MKVEDCSICMKKIKVQDRTHTACNHIFHFSCLVKNMKHNFNTGYICPLCRNPFIKLKPEHQTNSVFSRPVASSPWPAIGFSIAGPVARPLVIQGNRIIQPSRIQRPSQRRPSPSSTRSVESEEERITKFIDELNYEALKRELRTRGLSTRGYLRSSFEKRLFNAMRNQ